MSTVIVDAGFGNLGSVINLLKRLGEVAKVTSDPDVIATATRLILPGVGSFDAAMRSLRGRGLEEPLNERVKKVGVPVLGICLGMQVLAEGSDEGSEKGLGWLSGWVERLDASPGIRIPHMGWNNVRRITSNKLFNALADDARFYFAHSFAFPATGAHVAGITDHGRAFASVVHSENITGLQFHPEKSHRHGHQVVANFFAERC